MSYFKVGDKVRCINSQTANGEQIYVGYVGTITHIASDGAIVVDNMFGHNGNAVCWPEAFEKIKEEPKQMKATDKITVEITLAELAKIYAVMGKCNGETSSSLFELAGKTLDPENKRSDFMDNIKAADTVYFHRYERDFMKLMFPEPPKKSKEQIKIEELQETIDKAARELKELLEMGEKK